MKIWKINVKKYSIDWKNMTNKGEKEMREISTKKLKIGEHILVDGVEYVAEKEEWFCAGCEFRRRLRGKKCYAVPCDGVVLKNIDEIPTIIEASKERE